MGVRFNQDNTKAFVALGPANRVAVIDAKTYKVEKYILVASACGTSASHADYKLLFTTNGTSNDVTVIGCGVGEGDQVDHKTGRYPWGVVSGLTPMKAAAAE